MKKQFLSLIAAIGLTLGSAAQAMDKSAQQPAGYAKIAQASEADLAKDFAEYAKITQASEADLAKDYAEVVTLLEAELARIPRNIYLKAVQSDEFRNKVQEIFSNPDDLDTVLVNQEKQFKSHINYIKSPELDSPSAYEDLVKVKALLPLELFLYVKTIKAKHEIKALYSDESWTTLVEKAVKGGQSVDAAEESVDTLFKTLKLRKIQEIIIPPQPAASVSTK